MDRFTGGCLCGNVRIVASGLPYRVGLCHCLDCRKHHEALSESFFAPLETELLDRQTLRHEPKHDSPSSAGSRAFYNSRRRHSTLGQRSPEKYEEIMMRQELYRQQSPTNTEASTETE